VIAFWYIPKGFDRHSYWSQEAIRFQMRTLAETDKAITDNFLKWFEKLEKDELEHWKEDH